MKFAMLAFMIILISGLIYYYKKEIKVISYMRWDHVGDTEVDGNKLNIIRFTCKNDDKKGFIVHSAPDLLKHLSKNEAEIVEVSVLTDGQKLIRQRGSFYMVPFIDGKPYLYNEIIMLNPSDTKFVKCQ